MTVDYGRKFRLPWPLMQTAQWNFHSKLAVNNLVMVDHSTPLKQLDYWPAQDGGTEMDQTLSCIYQKIVASGRRKFIGQSDNCPCQFRNWLMLAFLTFMVHTGILDEAGWRFLVKGRCHVSRGHQCRRCAHH
jgi:hypothetical protein